MFGQKWPEKSSPEEEFAFIMERLHFRWRIAVCVPFVYLLLGFWAMETVFAPERGRPGIMPMSDELFGFLCILAGFFLGFIWITLGRSLAGQYEALREAASAPEGFLREAKRHQLTQFMQCDLAASPGIVLFIFQGDILVLFLFAIASMAFYLRAMPSGHRLGEALFRSGRSA